MTGQSDSQAVVIMCLPADTPFNRQHVAEAGLLWEFVKPAVPSRLSTCRMCGGEMWMSNVTRKQYVTLVFSGVKAVPVCAVCVMTAEMEAEGDAGLSGKA